MNNYFVELVKSEVKKLDNIAIVKYFCDKDSYLIFNYKTPDPHIIVFKDYKFNVMINRGNYVLELEFSFDSLTHAVEYMNARNY